MQISLKHFVHTNFLSILYRYVSSYFVAKNPISLNADNEFSVQKKSNPNAIKHARIWFKFKGWFGNSCFEIFRFMFFRILFPCLWLRSKKDWIKRNELTWGRKSKESHMNDIIHSTEVWIRSESKVLVALFSVKIQMIKIPKDDDGAWRQLDYSNYNMMTTAYRILCRKTCEW